MTQERKLKPNTFDGLTPGSVVEIHGVPCRLQHVNTGKRRLTFVPVDPGRGVPHASAVHPRLQVKKIHHNPPGR